MIAIRPKQTKSGRTRWTTISKQFHILASENKLKNSPLVQSRWNLSKNFFFFIFVISTFIHCFAFNLIFPWSFSLSMAIHCHYILKCYFPNAGPNQNHLLCHCYERSHTQNQIHLTLHESQFFTQSPALHVSPLSITQFRSIFFSFEISMRFCNINYVPLNCFRISLFHLVFVKFDQWMKEESEKETESNHWQVFIAIVIVQQRTKHTELIEFFLLLVAMFQ